MAETLYVILNPSYRKSKYMFRQKNEIALKYITILVITAIAAFGIGIVILDSILSPEEIRHFNAAYTLVSGIGITLFMHFVGMRSEHKRDALLHELQSFNKIQQNIRTSVIEGPLLDISQKLQKLARDLKTLREEIDEKRYGNLHNKRDEFESVGKQVLQESDSIRH